MAEPTTADAEATAASAVTYGSLDRALSDVPVLRAVRARYRKQAPLKGARIAIPRPVTAHFIVLAGLLEALGAQTRYAAERGDSIDDPKTSAIGGARHRTRASDDKAGEERDGILSVLEWPDGGAPNLIIDYDGYSARLVHLGIAVESGLARGAVDPDDTEIYRSLRKMHSVSWSAIATNLIGLTECTAKGAAKLRHIETTGGLLFPAIDASLGRVSGSGLDRDHLAVDTLAGLFARLALSQIELFTNGASYRPALYGFPASLTLATSDLSAADQEPRGSALPNR